MADSDTSPCGEREDYGFVSTSSNSLFYFLCFGGDGAVNGAEGPLELSWRVPAILRSSIVDTKTKRVLFAAIFLFLDKSAGGVQVSGFALFGWVLFAFEGPKHACSLVASVRWLHLP